MKAFLAEVKAAVDEGPPVFRFRASNGDVDRQNERVDPAGWETAEFEANPIFMWSHDYSQPPIGKVVALDKNEDGLLASVVFDQSDDFARKIQGKYQQGIMNAVSVGFISLEMQPPTERGGPLVHVRQSLMELSAVPIPALPSALMFRSAEHETADGGDQGVTKAGRVLSSKNEARLRQAATLLAEVLDQIGAAEPDDADADDKAAEPDAARFDDWLSGLTAAAGKLKG